MSGRKYAADYRIENHVLPDGRTESTRVYQGPYYTFTATKAELSRLRRNLFIGAGSTLALLIPMLLDNTRLGRTVYIVLPAVLSLLPVYLLLAAARRLGFPEDPFTREHRDKTDRRIRGASAGMSVLLAISCAGCLTLGARHGFAQGEIFCMVSLFLALGVSIFLLTQRKKATTKAAAE